MHLRTSIAATALLLAVIPAASASSVEKIRNQKVIVTEDTLAPGQSEPTPDTLPSVIVYMAGDAALIAPTHGKPHKVAIKEGETVYQSPQPGTITNTGASPLHFVRIQFLTAGSPETWGTSGLAPNYKLLLENDYARAYDIKIPAQTREPQHTHHDRVVVALSGAQLEHTLPSGEIQPSTLQTGEIVWRLGGTHIGHNLGNTDLWVIAIEPK